MLHDKLDDPGAALSFSGVLLSVEDVATAVGRVLDRPRPVTAVPRWRGAQVRVVDAFPRPRASTASRSAYGSVAGPSGACDATGVPTSSW